jgi:hypothetical protein
MHSNEEEADVMEHIQVSIRTPDGTWPTEGFFAVPVHQKISQLLEHAKSSLRIESTEDWVAMAGEKTLDTTTSYRKNGLTKRVSIYYGVPVRK